MQRELLRGGRRLAVAAGAAALLWPLQARADTFVNAVTDTSVCQLGGVVITTQSPVTLLPSTTVTASLGGVGYSLNGSGTCTGSYGALPFTLVGSGVTVGPPTCATFTSLNGAGTLTLGGSSYSVLIALAGSVAGEQMVIVPAAALSGGVGIAQLTLSQASLVQCTQPSGTTQLSYNGTLLLAL